VGLGLDESAITTLKKWKCKPAQKDGNPFWRKLPSRSSSIKLNGFASNCTDNAWIKALHGEVEFKFPITQLISGVIERPANN
jgi:hypothetical protein